MNTDPLAPLDEALARMRRELIPARDLWPAIARATDQGAPRPVRTAMLARRPQWPMALAASLALVGLVAALSWSVLQKGATTMLALHGQASPLQTMVSFEGPQDATYLNTRAALERMYEERLAMLAPATRARVQADLEIIRKANADIRDALSRDPASPLLQQLLRSTWQQEIDLYTNVSQATEPMLTRRT